ARGGPTPLAARGHAPPRGAAAAAAAMKTLGGFLTARILVVDDQESNVRLLERWGYSNVISTTCSAEVPELFSRMNPDLLLLDLLMPPPDGFELLEELQRATQDDVFRPVLVL